MHEEVLKEDQPVRVGGRVCLLHPCLICHRPRRGGRADVIVDDEPRWRPDATRRADSQVRSGGRGALCARSLRRLLLPLAQQLARERVEVCVHAVVVVVPLGWQHLRPVLPQAEDASADSAEPVSNLVDWLGQQAFLHAEGQPKNDA